MDIGVKTENGYLVLTSRKKVSDTWVNKLHANVNKQRITAYCQDYAIDVPQIVIEGNSSICEMKYEVVSANVDTLSRVDKLHLSFLFFVGSLPEIEVSTETEKNENRVLVKKILEEWNGTEKRLGIRGAILLSGNSKCQIIKDCGLIGGPLLKEMFEAWLQVHK